MILLDICAVILVGLGIAILREVKVTAERQRALFKTEGLHRFK